jgi:hypothetical protein
MQVRPQSKNLQKTEVVLEPIPAYNQNPIKINYLEKEQTNRKLGLSGEEKDISRNTDKI